jgi:hypothetical protein
VADTAALCRPEDRNADYCEIEPKAAAVEIEAREAAFDAKSGVVIPVGTVIFGVSVFSTRAIGPSDACV